MRPEAVALIRDTRRAVYFSAASAWELEITAAKGKLSLPAGWLLVAESTGFLQIPVTAVVAQASAQLPWHHSDPFDRVIIAQAMEHNLQVATRDAHFATYGVPVLAV
jgi:PIN domain nuclease of toxin-antitoxin system